MRTPTFQREMLDHLCKDGAYKSSGCTKSDSPGSQTLEGIRLENILCCNPCSSLRDQQGAPAFHLKLGVRWIFASICPPSKSNLETSIPIQVIYVGGVPRKHRWRESDSGKGKKTSRDALIISFLKTEIKSPFHKLHLLKWTIPCV